jgi:hypothetical protein
MLGFYNFSNVVVRRSLQQQDGQLVAVQVCLRVSLLGLWIPDNLILAASCGKSAVSCQLWES